LTKKKNEKDNDLYKVIYVELSESQKSQKTNVYQYGTRIGWISTVKSHRVLSHVGMVKGVVP
jgi:hypothetical protein